MSKAALESGRVSHIFWSDDETLIGCLQTESGEVKFKGFMPFVHLGDLVELHGSWYTHKKFGEQVDVQSYDFPLKNEADAAQLAIADSCKFLFKELEHI